MPSIPTKQGRHRYFCSPLERADLEKKLANVSDGEYRNVYVQNKQGTKSAHWELTREGDNCWTGKKK